MSRLAELDGLWALGPLFVQIAEDLAARIQRELIVARRNSRHWLPLTPLGRYVSLLP